MLSLLSLICSQLQSFNLVLPLAIASLITSTLAFLCYFGFILASAIIYAQLNSPLDAFGPAFYVMLMSLLLLVPPLLLIGNNVRAGMKRRRELSVLSAALQVEDNARAEEFRQRRNHSVGAFLCSSPDRAYEAGCDSFNPTPPLSRVVSISGLRGSTSEDLLAAAFGLAPRTSASPLMQEGFEPTAI